MTPLSTPAAQGTVAVLNAADRMREFMEGSRLGFAVVPVAHLAEWRKLLSELSASPSPEALPASGVEAVFEAMENDPFWQDASLAGTTQQDQRIRHYAEVAVRVLTSAPATEDR